MATRTNKSFDRAVLPPDLAGLPNLWQRRPADAWTEQPLRATVVAFLDQFLEDTDWACEWKVVEKFAMQDKGDINVYVRRGPDLLIENPKFLQRNATPILVFTVIHTAKPTILFEVGVRFPEANDVVDSVLLQRLTQVKLTWEALNR